MVGWQINGDQLFLEVGMKMSSNYKDILDLHARHCRTTLLIARTYRYFSSSYNHVVSVTSFYPLNEIRQSRKFMQLRSF